MQAFPTAARASLTCINVAAHQELEGRSRKSEVGHEETQEPARRHGSRFDQRRRALHRSAFAGASGGAGGPK